MCVFSFTPFPEEEGLETVNKVDLKGFIYDIHGQPIIASVKVSLNKRDTCYKDDFNLSGAEVETVSDETGAWTILLPDNYHMPLDSYYRITLNNIIFRKFLPDFPPENFLNLLNDY